MSKTNSPINKHPIGIHKRIINTHPLKFPNINLSSIKQSNENNQLLKPNQVNTCNQSTAILNHQAKFSNKTLQKSLNTAITSLSGSREDCDYTKRSIDSRKSSILDNPFDLHEIIDWETYKQTKEETGRASCRESVASLV